MIGYDAGARLGLDDLSGPSGVIGAGYFQTPEILQLVDGFMDGIAEMAVKNSAEAEEPDSVITAVADMTARMYGGAQGGNDVDRGEALLEQKSSGLQQALTGYSGNAARALFHDARAVPFHPGYAVMANDGSTRYEGNNGALLPARRGEIQQSKFENDGGVSLAGLAAVGLGNDPWRYDLPEIPGLAGDGRDEDADPQAAEGVGGGQGVDFIPRSAGKFQSGEYRNPNASLDMHHLAERDELYARIVARDPMGDAETRMRHGSSVIDDTVTERTTGIGMIADDGGYGVGRGSPEPGARIGGDRVDDAIGGLFGKILARDDLSGGYVPGDNDAAMAGLGGSDERAGLAATGEPNWPSLQGGEIGKPAKSQFPEELDSPGRAEMGSPAGFSAFVSPDRLSVPGLSDMFRNADRFLPKQAVFGRGDGNETIGEAGEGAETGSMFSRARELASGLDDFNPQLSTMPAEHATAFGSRGGPSGHKNDPIYMVAISQATGMLMPMVPTSGTSTRSPPIPGQRNLP